MDLVAIGSQFGFKLTPPSAGTKDKLSTGEEPAVKVETELKYAVDLNKLVDRLPNGLGEAALYEQAYLTLPESGEERVRRITDLDSSQKTKATWKWEGAGAEAGGTGASRHEVEWAVEPTVFDEAISSLASDTNKIEKVRYVLPNVMFGSHGEALEEAVLDIYLSGELRGFANLEVEFKEGYAESAVAAFRSDVQSLEFLGPEVTTVKALKNKKLAVGLDQSLELDAATGLNVGDYIGSNSAVFDQFIPSAFK